MSDATDTPPPASPYGPADGANQLFDASGEADPAVASSPAPTASVDTPAVTRARRTIGLLAIVLPIAGLVLCAVAIVVQVATGAGGFGIDPVSEFISFILIFLGPTLLVLGLHMVIWRALVRPLSRMTPGGRVGTIIGVGAVLSLFSVILMIVLVFIGIVIVSGVLDATGQWM